MHQHSAISGPGITLEIPPAAGKREREDQGEDEKQRLGFHRILIRGGRESYALFSPSTSRSRAFGSNFPWLNLRQHSRHATVRLIRRTLGNYLPQRSHR